MKLQVMPVASSSTTADERERNNEDITPNLAKVRVKDEPAEFSDTPESTDPEAPGTRHSHPRKIMMEKWMNVQDTFDRRHLSPRNHDNKASPRPSRSPPPSPIKLNHIPIDPRKWTSEHVGRWLEALEVKYALAVDMTDFKMNGRALCLMNRQGFLSRVPGKGAILYEDFRTRLRRYLSACRRRVRSTVINPSVLASAKLPHQMPTLLTNGHHEDLNQRQTIHPGLFPHMMRPPSAALLGHLPPEHALSTAGGAVGNASVDGKAAAPIQNGPSHPHRALSNAGLPGHHLPPGANHALQMSLEAHRAWQQLHSGSPLPRFPPTRVPSTSAPTGVNSSLLPHGQIHPAFYSYPGGYPFVPPPGALENIPPMSGNGSSVPRTAPGPYRTPSSFQTTPSSLHETPLSLHTAPSLPTHSSLLRAPSYLHTAPSSVESKPNASTTSSTQNTAVSSSCPMHGARELPTTTAALPLSPYPSYPGQQYLQSLPYYQFVPLYRTMKVFGQFQPLTYGYRYPNGNESALGAHEPSLPPSTVASAPEPEGPPSPPRAAESKSMSRPQVPQETEQSQALDLSMSKRSANGRTSAASVSRAAPLGMARDSGARERKRIKMEPNSP